MGMRLPLFCALWLLTGCATDHSLTGSLGGDVLWQFPQDAPAWLLAAPAPDAEGVHFLGISGLARNEAQARQAAMADSLNQLARYVGVNISVLNRYMTQGNARESEAMDATVSASTSTTLAADAMVNKGTQAWFLRRIRKNGAEYFEARLLFTVAREQLDLLTDYVDEKQRALLASRRKNRAALAVIQRQKLDALARSGAAAVVGTGTASGKQSRQLAERAALASAKHDAYLKLNDRLNGARVVGASATDHNGASSGVTSVILDGQVRGEVVSESVDWEDGQAIATVIMRAL